MISQAIGNNKKMLIRSEGENKGTQVDLNVFNYDSSKTQVVMVINDSMSE